MLSMLNILSSPLGPCAMSRIASTSSAIDILSPSSFPLRLLVAVSAPQTPYHEIHDIANHLHPFFCSFFSLDVRLVTIPVIDIHSLLSAEDG